MADRVRARCVVRVEIDGRPLTGFPLVRELEVRQVNTHFAYTMKTFEQFRTLPDEELVEPSIIAVEPDESLVMRLAGQTDRGVPIAHRGLLLIFDGELCIPERERKVTAKVDEEPAQLTGVLAGE